MPIIKSAEKRVRTSKISHDRNTAVKAEMRTAIKNLESKIRDNNLDEAKTAYTTAARKLEKAAKKGVIHKNKAARNKSQLAKKLNQLSA